MRHICLCVLLLSWTVTATAQSLFGPATEFNSAGRNALCVATADIDGDGHIDVILGEDGGVSLWLNDGHGQLSLAPWVPTDQRGVRLNDKVLSIAVGDVDLDGDVDVVLGTTLWIRLFLNDAGTLETLSAWPEVIPSTTNGIGLGDVDGDGDLDIVCANGYTTTNRGVANTVYRNDGGTFPAMAMWTQSDASRVSTSLALGDVNGDGLVDAVFGNQDGPNRLYPGDATGLLATTFSWEDIEARPTLSVALGDITGDGIFELVTADGNFGGSLYPGAGTAFSDTASWIASSPARRQAVGIGDVDLDGLLDVVFGMATGNQAHLNTGGMPETLASWTANDVLGTVGVTLADLDGEGDLELIGAGTAPAAGQFYENLTPLYSEAPDWTRPGPRRDARDVELVDLDGDGDLELFLAHFKGPTEVYNYESDGTHYGTWDWRNSPDSTGAYPPTKDGAIADMNRDGHPDLLMPGGGPLVEVSVYLNAGTIFEPSPLTTNGPGNGRYLGAWGDFAADGYPDPIVSSLPAVQGDEIFSNPDGIPDWVQIWEGSPCLATKAMHPVDVDGDGDLDLVLVGQLDGGGLPSSPCWGQPDEDGVFVHKNSAGTLSGSATGYLLGVTTVNSGTVGYFDADALPDVIAVGQEDFLLSNTGDGFDIQSAPWSGSVPGHSNIVPGDVDGNGSTDAIATRNAGAVSFIDVFLSDAGHLPDSPQSIAVATSIPVLHMGAGDVDGDGDLDLVTAGGSSKTNNPPGTVLVPGQARLYLARRTPAFRGDFAAPTNHLPANPAVVRNVAADSAASNVYQVSFDLYDVESDPAHVTLEYQYEGEGIWRPMQAGSPATFASSPTGVHHAVSWDVTEVAFTSRPVVVRVQATDAGGAVGASARHVSRFIKTVGKVVPQRPAIRVPTTAVAFPTVTVGDTASVQVVVHSQGNEDLVIDGVDLPSDMTLAGGPPATLAPGERDTLEVLFHPTTDVTSPGDIDIRSNDPTRPVVTVTVSVDVRTLQANTRLFSGDDVELPIDQDATVVVTPLPLVNVESGWLFHRVSGDTAFADSIPLARLETRWFAIVPAAVLDEAGLEYYVRLENSGVFGFDPADAPGTWYSQEVGAPTELHATPVPNAGQGFAEGQPIEVGAVLPDGSRFSRGWIHYRAGASAVWDTTGLSGSGASATGEIPGTAAGVRGVDYWIEVETASTRLTDPAVSPASSPHHLRVTIADLQEPSSHPGERYRMFSFPLEVEGTVLGAIADDLGGTSDTRSRVAVWSAAQGRYREGDAIGAARQGAAYWVITRDVHQLDIAPATSISPDMSTPFEVRLDPGWNMVGTPFPFDVSWYDVVRDPTAVPGLPQRYTGPGNNYAFAGTLQPFSGYWVHNDADSVVSIWIPPIEHAVPGATVPTEVPLTWGIDVTAGEGKIALRQLQIGVSEKSKNARDELDRLLPPLAPESPLDLYAVGEGGQWLSRDARSVSTAPGWGHAWHFDVAVAEHGRVPVTLGFAFDAVPEGSEVLLLDREVKRTHDLSDGASVEVYVTGAERTTSPDGTRFVLLVGDAQYIEEHRSLLPGPPTKTALHQNFPNPFNPTTVIRYELAGDAHMSLKIYDVRGALVRTLEDRTLPAGRYEVGWDGTDNRGSNVASGIYFYRLVSSEGVSLTRKMVVLK